MVLLHITSFISSAAADEHNKIPQIVIDKTEFICHLKIVNSKKIYSDRLLFGRNIKKRKIMFEL
jgi:hypothetical protein